MDIKTIAKSSISTPSSFTAKSAFAALFTMSCISSIDNARCMPSLHKHNVLREEYRGCDERSNKPRDQKFRVT